MTDRPQRCATCRWWHEGGAKMARVSEHPNPEEDVGTCEISPPTVILVGPGWAEATYPETCGDRRCGEWEPIEEGIDGGEEVNVENVVQIGRAA